VNSAHILWRGHTRVYPRLGYVGVTGVVWSACGVVLSGRRFRSQQGTERDARLLGLRPCGRCWRRTDANERPL